MLTLDHDRRTSPRLAISRPCKVYEPRTRRYIAGATCNVGSGGMLLRLDRAVAFEPGDLLFVAVAQKRRQCLVRGTDMTEMEVVRATPSLTGTTTLALRFADPAQDLTASLRRAA